MSPIIETEAVKHKEFPLLQNACRGKKEKNGMDGCESERSPLRTLLVTFRRPKFLQKFCRYHIRHHHSRLPRDLNHRHRSADKAQSSDCRCTPCGSWPSTAAAESGDIDGPF